MDDLTTKLAEALQPFVTANNSGEFETLTVRTTDITKAREALRLYEQAKAQPVQDEREAFEREMRKVGEWGRKNLRRDGKGVYLNSWTAVMWMVWQARAALAATPAPAEPIAALIRRVRSTTAMGGQTGPYAYGGENFGRYLREATEACDQALKMLAELAATPAEPTVKDSLTPDAILQAARDGGTLGNIESPFNACMHRDHCEGWKRAALAATPAPAEPVAWMVGDKEGRTFIIRTRRPVVSEGEMLTPLYAAPVAATPAPAPHLDTARLDWMETQKSVSMTRLRESAAPHAARYWCIEDRDGDDLTADTEPGDRQTLREAIDAARAGQGKEASNGN